MSVAKARSRVAVATKKHKNKSDDGSSSLLQEARRDLAAAKLEAYIQRVVDASVPLSAEQRDRLALLLRGAS